MPAGNIGTNGKQHILFISYHLPKGNEAGAFRPWMEARLLKMAGYQVTVLTSGVHYMTGEDIRTGRGWITEEMADGIRILRTWAPTGHRRSILRRLLNYSSYTFLAGLGALFKVGKPDRVLAGTDPILVVPMAYVVAKLWGATLSLDERDLFPETAIALGVINEGPVARFLLKMQQFFRRKAIGILAATPGIRDQLLAYGICPDKVHFLYNGDVFLDEDLKRTDSGTPLKEKVKKPFLVGYAGGLGRANDIWTLLRAANHLRDLDDLGIVIIGEGEFRRTYEGYCEQQKLTNVVFTGPKPRYLARHLLQQMDLCVHLYVDAAILKGGLASKIFDYHGLGKPTIFCGSGDTVSLLEESQGGLAVPTGDDRALAEVIRRLHRDAPLRKRMGESAQRWFETHISLEVSCAMMQAAMEGYDQGR